MGVAVRLGRLAATPTPTLMESFEGFGFPQKFVSPTRPRLAEAAQKRLDRWQCPLTDSRDACGLCDEPPQDHLNCVKAQYRRISHNDCQQGSTPERATCPIYIVTSRVRRRMEEAAEDGGKTNERTALCRRRVLPWRPTCASFARDRSLRRLPRL